MKTLRVVLLLVLASCFLQINAGAQQAKQAAQAPTGLALEITYFKGNRPAYQTVPNTAWYASFRRIEGWKPAGDALPVQAVNIASRMEGTAVRVVVSLHLGKKLFEKQEGVGSYLLQENERLTVNDMTTYGLEPFEVAVLRVERKSASVPAVTSNAPSVEVTDVQAVDSTFPMFKLTLRNTSSKNISALFLEMFAGGRLRTSAMPHNQDAAPLIVAGETFELKRELNKDARQSGGGFAPETAPNQTLVIKTAVFDDGTYEGDAKSAAQYRAFALGNRTQLAQLVARYNQALQSTESDVRLALESLREQVNALGTEADPLVLNKLLSDFNGVVDRAFLKDVVEAVMFELKKDALKVIDRFRVKQDAGEDKEGLRAWLITNRDRYQKWHGYLKKL
ncbi:MAG TPA: hypothetical protein VGC66_17335 [Pyrinomonadaceae bacterium]|jgi:hypothetical protein